MAVTMRKNILYFVVIYLVMKNQHFLSSYLNEGFKKGHRISIFCFPSFSSEFEVTLCKYEFPPQLISIGECDKAKEIYVLSI